MQFIICQCCREGKDVNTHSHQYYHRIDAIIGLFSVKSLVVNLNVLTVLASHTADTS